MKTLLLTIFLITNSIAQHNSFWKLAVLFNDDIQDTLSAELVTNGTFTTGVSGWTVVNGALKHYSSDYNAVGRTNVMLDSCTSTAAGVYFTPTLTFEADGIYYMSFDYYIPAGQNTDRIRCRMFGATAVYLDYLDVVGTWTTYTRRIDNANDNTSLRIYFYDATVAGGTAGDKVYIDNVSIKKLIP